MAVRVAVVNSKVSNLRNITKAVAHCGAQFTLTDKPEELAQADKIIMPGVGAFQAGMDELKGKGLDQAIKDSVKKGKMFLGICLGMQLLLEKSFEFGEHDGLALIEGQARQLPAGKMWTDETGQSWTAKVPHVGWDAVDIKKDDKVLGLAKGQKPYFYFTHSYAVYPKDASITVGAVDSGYGPFSVIIRKDNVVACQFHLELSGAQGLSVLKGFLDA